MMPDRPTPTENVPTFAEAIRYEILSCMSDDHVQKHPSDKPDRLREEDPELEQEYRMLARILLDFYYERQRHQRSFPQDGFDNID
jgi:hypothetical protein